MSGLFFNAATNKTNDSNHWVDPGTITGDTQYHEGWIAMYSWLDVSILSTTLLPKCWLQFWKWLQSFQEMRTLISSLTMTIWRKVGLARVNFTNRLCIDMTPWQPKITQLMANLEMGLAQIANTGDQQGWGKWQILNMAWHIPWIIWVEHTPGMALTCCKN